MRKQPSKKNSKHNLFVDNPKHVQNSAYVPLSEVSKLVDAIVSIYDLEKRYFPKDLNTPQIEHIELFDIKKIKGSYFTLTSMNKKYPIEELLLLEEKATAIYKLLIGEPKNR